jgi:plastocyanin
MSAIAERRSSGWFWLVQVAATVEAALLLVAGAYLRDAEALTLAFVVLATLGWILLRPGRVIPVLVRALVFADVAVWMVPAAVSNALNQGSLGSIALPATLGTTSVVGLLAAAGFLLTRGSPTAGRRISRVVAAAAVLVILAVTGFAAATGSVRSTTAAGDLVISATNARYSATTLTADHGTLAVDFTNNDLFWHTFTVTALGVDIRLPVKGRQRVSFNAPSGTYEFFCAIPGHKGIGMRGTLTIN